MILVSFKRSRRVRDLARTLGIRYASSRNPRVTNRCRNHRTLINWGWSRLPVLPNRNQRVINNPRAVKRAVNKLTALSFWREAQLSTVPWTTSLDEAEAWLANDHAVVERHVLTGSHGRGIIIREDELDDTAPLYTKYIPRAREFRLHVVEGTVVLYSQKKRVNGFEELPEFNPQIRHHNVGWIYAVNDVRDYGEEIRNLAVEAVRALNLNFGAVDILVKQDVPYLLEVNTAPGIQGDTTFRTYCETFRRHYL